MAHENARQLLVDVADVFHGHARVDAPCGLKPGALVLVELDGHWYEAIVRARGPQGERWAHMRYLEMLRLLPG